MLDTDPGSDLMRRLIGLAAVIVVALFTVPALAYACKIRHSGGGYVQLSGVDGEGTVEGEAEVEEDRYEDPDGVATQDSIRAFTDTRPRVALWLGTLVGLGSSIAARVVAVKGVNTLHVLSEVVAWTEPACWVSLSTTLARSKPVDIGLANQAHRPFCVCSVHSCPPSTITKRDLG